MTIDLPTELRRGGHDPSREEQFGTARRPGEAETTFTDWIDCWATGR